MMTRVRRSGLAPEEGWLTLGLVLLMCLSLAWALDDARLVLGRDADTDYLQWAAAGGVLVGFIGPLVGWGRWTTYLVGAVFGALLIPLIVGAVLVPAEGASLGYLYSETARATIQAFRDLVLTADRLTTPETGHHLLILGLIVWASSMFASFAVFGHRRPLNAVLLIGLLLILNMAFTTRDQLPFLILFSLSSLFLLIRSHTLEEQGDWLRRRIGDPSALSGMYLRGGTIFIGLTVAGALLLTNVAASDPLAGAWTDIGARAIDWSRGIAKFLPQSGTGPVIGPSFGSSVAVSGRWVTDRATALTIEVPEELIAVKPYWRVVIHDQLLFEGYRRSEDAVAVEREPDTPLLDATRDAIPTEGRQPVSFRITPSTATSGYIFAPQSPISVDVPTTLRLVDGEDGFLAGIERRGGNGPYTVQSVLPQLGDDVAGGLTKNRLRVAGEDYPAEIVATYAQPPDAGILGPDARQILEDIRQQAPPTPYDFAKAVETYLRDDEHFTYDPDVKDELDRCQGVSYVECFAKIKAGYCQYYAGLMLALLREEGIPSRIAEGFLPGHRELSTGIETVTNQQAHSWVEVYFPGYGWVDFDPTGGGVAALTELPIGLPQASGPPRPTFQASIPRRDDEFDPQRQEPDGNPVTTARSGPLGPLVAIALLLAVIVGVLAVVAWRRGPRGPVSADGAYGMVTRMASRFGFGPRPNQTVYEFAGALGEVLPESRPELETVARAKVEVVYGGRSLGPDRMAGLREAQRRLRTALLRLAFRRKERRRRR